jgi:hypothetical protein
LVPFNRPESARSSITYSLAAFPRCRAYHLDFRITD